MDTSEKYIKMCQQAQEIQDLQHYPILEDWQKLEELKEYFVSFECGDFIAFNSNESDIVNIWVFGDPIHEKEVKSIKCWLPRQDQLQDIIIDEIYGGSCFRMLMNFGLKLREDTNYDMTSTAEQLWLSFIMKEKFHKRWNEQDEKWD